MPEIAVTSELVARCGLYCGACKKYQKGSCPGCQGNEKATWCKVRTCCLEHDYSSCAMCDDFPDPQRCKKFNNFFSRIIGFVLRSDRRACILQIKESGLDEHARRMAELGRPSIKP